MPRSKTTFRVYGSRYKFNFRLLTLNTNMPVSCGICGICKTQAGQDHAGVCTMIYLPLFSGYAARIRTPEMSQQFAPFHQNSYRSQKSVNKLSSDSNQSMPLNGNMKIVYF